MPCTSTPITGFKRRPNPEPSNGLKPAKASCVEKFLQANSIEIANTEVAVKQSPIDKLSSLLANDKKANFDYENSDTHDEGFQTQDDKCQVEDGAEQETTSAVSKPEPEHGSINGGDGDTDTINYQAVIPSHSDVVDSSLNDGLQDDSMVGKLVQDKHKLVGLNTRFQLYIEKVESLRSENHQLQGKNTLLKERLSEADEDKARLADSFKLRIEELVKEKVRAMEDKNSFEEYIVTLKEQLAQAEQSIERYNKSEIEICSELSTVKNLLAAKEQALSELGKLTASEKDKNVQLEKTLKDLRIELVSSQEKLNIAVNEVTIMKDRLNELRTEYQRLQEDTLGSVVCLERKNEQVSQLTKQLENLRQEFDSIQSSIKLKMSSDFEKKLESSFVKRSLYDDLMTNFNKLQYDSKIMQGSLDSAQRLLENAKEDFEASLQAKSRRIQDLEKACVRLSRKQVAATEYQEDVCKELETFRLLLDQIEQSTPEPISLSSEKTDDHILDGHVDQEQPDGQKESPLETSSASPSAQVSNSASCKVM